LTGAVCTVVAARRAGEPDYTQHKTEDFQLCRDVLLALSRAAAVESEQTFKAVVDACRDLCVQAKLQDDLSQSSRSGNIMARP
jgi:hypothetical protein